MWTIIHTVEFDGIAPADVYELITTEKGLAGWWTTDVGIDGDGVGATRH